MFGHMEENVKNSGLWYANWAMLMGTLSFDLNEVALVGKEAISINNEIQSNYLPTAMFLGRDVENLPLLEGKLVNEETWIYVCRNKVCKLPVTNIEDAIKQID